MVVVVRPEGHDAAGGHGAARQVEGTPPARQKNATRIGQTANHPKRRVLWGEVGGSSETQPQPTCLLPPGAVQPYKKSRPNGGPIRPLFGGLAAGGIRILKKRVGCPHLLVAWLSKIIISLESADLATSVRKGAYTQNQIGCSLFFVAHCILHMTEHCKLYPFVGGFGVKE